MSKPPFAVLLLAALAMASPATAQDAAAAPAEGPAEMLQIYDASEVTLDQFIWVNRPVVVFADSPFDPRFVEQMELLQARPAELNERDVVVITDTDPDARSDIRRQLRPRGFQLTVIGKDGEVKLRKPSPWDTREISRSIDKMPLRQRELREQRAGGDG